MNKKEYMMPTMEIVKIQQQNQLLAGSINDNLNDDTVDNGWSRLDDFDEE